MTVAFAQSVSCVRNWNDSFGESLQLLRLGCDFMQARVGGMHVPTQFESEQAAEARSTFRRHRTQRLLAVRYARLAAEFETQEGELQSALSEITNALEILFPRADDAQQLGDYLLRGTEKNENQSPAELQVLKQEPDDTSRPSKRAKRVESAAGGSATEEPVAAATDSNAVTLLSPPVLADSAVDDIEWEDDGAAPSAAAVSAIAAHAAAAAPPQPSRSDPAVTSATQLEGAAAVFGEFQAADSSDSHWWLDEEQDDEHALEGESGEFEEDAGGDDGGGEWVDEHKDGGSNNDNLTHGIARNYSLSIEFDAHIAVENEGSCSKHVLDARMCAVQRRRLGVCVSRQLLTSSFCFLFCLRADTAPVFQALREAWSRIEKSFLPLLTEWIDTLTRIELDQADLSALATGASASSAATAALTESQLHTLRQQRDSYLKRCVHAREQIHTLRVKCARLGVRISSHTADRNDAVRRETELSITSADGDDASAPAAGASAAAAARPGAAATRSSSSSRAAAATAAASSASADVAAHTRHAANLLGRRAAAEKRAVTKIRSVKRKHAQELEAQRLAARQQPQGEEAAAQGGVGSSSDPLRRPFSAAGRIPSAAANIKAEQVDEGEYI